MFPSAEIYGGFRSTYDYGPLGVLMARNVKDAWWRSMVQLRQEVVGLDAAILSSPRIWEASGHLKNFTDPLVDCRTCKQRWRADQLPTTDDGKLKCPNCGGTDFTEARPFNLMFKTFVGPVEDEGAVAYLRPETAQGHFVNFANVLQTEHLRPPFGTAQIGKSFRNEITPGNFVFRTREFEQMELEYFVPPDEAPALVRVLVQRTSSSGTCASAYPGRCCACAPTAKKSCRIIRRGRPTSSSPSRGAGESSRASPTARITT